MNNIEELKTKKPENLKSRSSVLADYVTDDNSGGYFVVECGNCGEIFPSQKLDGGGAIADTGDYGDSYCPHCNAVDPDECDNAGLVWNIQQAKINALIAQLEATRKELSDLHNQEFQQRLANAEHQLYMKDLAIHNIKASRMAQFRKRLKAEAELSAANEKLKGDQVPVAIVELNDNLTVAEIRGDIPRRKAVRELCEGALVIGQELFAAAPRPSGFTVDGE